MYSIELVLNDPLPSTPATPGGTQPSPHWVPSTNSVYPLLEPPSYSCERILVHMPSKRHARRGDVEMVGVGNGDWLATCQSKGDIGGC